MGTRQVETTDTDVEQLLTVEDVARIFRRSRWAIYRDVESGVLPYVRIGQSIRFSQASIREFIGACTVTPATEPARG